MDIKELNKSQLILLAVLLSFITSIATGITTVTLMQQAPKSITVPINRVVQQTVDKVEQVEGKTVTQTVVIKEEDLVVDAIAKNQSAVFSVTKDVLNPDFTTSEISAGRGFAVSTDGTVVADAMLVPDKEVYYLTNSSGKFKADFVSTNKAGFSFLKIGAPVNGKDKPTFTVPVFGDLSKMKIGQQVLLMGNTIVSSIFEGLNANKNIDLNVSKANTGGLVLDLDGEALGIALSPDNTTASFASIKEINNALNPSSTTTIPASSNVQ
jgi:S1-C subfamily serine protease